MRACRALRLLRDAAPAGGRQVHVMTVLTADNHLDLDALLELSATLGVGHCVTLLSNKGFRRGKLDALPPAGVTPQLLELWQRHPHLRVFRDYLARTDAFLRNDPALPRCRAGVQSFNIDHCGNVAPCIEKIDQPVGNVREAPIAELLAARGYEVAVADLTPGPFFSVKCDVSREPSVRACIRAAAPGAKECLKWGMPAFSYSRILVTFAAFKNHIGFYPTPPAVKAFAKELAKFVTADASIQFPLDKPLPLSLIKKITAFRVRESIEEDKKWRT